MSVKDNLIAARALIDTPEKWGQDEYQPHRGCYCVVGALAAANGWSEDQVWDAQANDALWKALPVRGNAGWIGLVGFNDHPDTTHADILALFDRAIAACDEQVAA